MNRRRMRLVSRNRIVSLSKIAPLLVKFHVSRSQLPSSSIHEEQADQLQFLADPISQFVVCKYVRARWCMHTAAIQPLGTIESPILSLINRVHRLSPTRCVSKQGKKKNSVCLPCRADNLRFTCTLLAPE